MANQKGDIVSADRHYFNRCVDINESTGKKTFETYSLWNRASDCELDNGNTVEDEIINIKKDITSFGEYYITKDAVDTELKKTLHTQNTTNSYKAYINNEWKHMLYAGAHSTFSDYNLFRNVTSEGVSAYYINTNPLIGGGLVPTTFTDLKYNKSTIAREMGNFAFSTVGNSTMGTSGYMSLKGKANTSISYFSLLPFNIRNFEKIIIEYDKNYFSGQVTICLTRLFSDYDSTDPDPHASNWTYSNHSIFTVPILSITSFPNASIQSYTFNIKNNNLLYYDYYYLAICLTGSMDLKIHKFLFE